MIKKIQITKSVRSFAGVGLIVLVVIAGFFIYNNQRATKQLPNSPDLAATDATTVPIDFQLDIAKINVVAPIIVNVDGADEQSYDKALEGGVAHFKGTALPGEGNNIFIFGHSSAYVASQYSKIFANLNELVAGDEIKIIYKNEDHNYIVKSKKVVEATDISVLDKTKIEQLTLMTCWPIGTDEKRLIVIAAPE